MTFRNYNKNRYCGCGCEQEIIPKKHHKWYQPKFILGHNSKGHHNKDKKFTEEHKRKIGNAVRGSNNGMWKGDNVSYNKLHVWVKRYLPQPELCQNCNVVKPYDLANVTGIYSRDLENWKYLCRRCHMLSDGRMYDNLKQFKEKLI